MPGLDDSKIIELFYARSEQAIVELSQKYGSVCSKIAKYSLQGTTQGRYLTGGVPPVRFSM